MVLPLHHDDKKKSRTAFMRYVELWSKQAYALPLRNKIAAIAFILLLTIGFSTMIRGMSLTEELRRGMLEYNQIVRQRAGKNGRNAYSSLHKTTPPPPTTTTRDGEGDGEKEEEEEVIVGKTREAGTQPATTSTDGIIPILIPTYSRPQYLRRVVESLRVNAHINETVLVFSQDGRYSEISDIIQSIDFAPVVHLWHSPPYLGIPSYFIRTDAPTAANVHFLLRFAFDYMRVPAAIILESDIELSTDGYDYFRWAFDQVAGGKVNLPAEVQAITKDRPTSQQQQPLGLLQKEQVLTINGYYEKSQKPPPALPQEGDEDNPLYTFSTDEYGFMVWGWLCPAWSWPAIRDGWTWFHNWDITVEYKIRQPLGKVSLSPQVSRTRNIGMQGINFDIRDPSEVAKWQGLFIPRSPTKFEGKEMQIIAGRRRK